jgi:hypothetical protein
MGPDIVPSSPNPTSGVLIGTAIRAALMVAGPSLAAHGVSVDDATGQAVAGAVMTLGGIGWSFWQKYRQAKLDHEGSVASAEMRMPVKAVAP